MARRCHPSGGSTVAFNSNAFTYNKDVGGGSVRAEPSYAAKQEGREKTLAAAWNQNLNDAVAYLTAITFTTGPSVVLPRNLLLLAVSAAPLPPIPVVLLKKSLLEMRTGPPSTFTAKTLLANILLETLTWQPVLDRTAPLALVV